MSEPANILGDALRAEIKEIVREALREERAEKTGASGAEKDTLLTADEAAALMGVAAGFIDTQQSSRSPVVSVEKIFAFQSLVYAAG